MYEPSDPKRCFKCGLTKTRAYFYAHPRMGDGLLGKCKDCSKADTKANRAANPERYSAYEAARRATSDRKDASAKVSRKHRDEHPDRYAVPNRFEQRG